MNVAKTTYRAVLVAAALSCFGLALPAQADDDDRRSRYSREYRDRSHDHRWSAPGYRYRDDSRHDYRKGYRHGYRDRHWQHRSWDRRYDRWRHHDRRWRGGYYDRRYYDRGWYSPSYSGYDRYPRRWHDDYDGDVELRIRIPF
jgi:hypothetical protein